MRCAGVTFADFCEKVMKYWFGRLLLRNVRFGLPREAIYVGQDHYYIAFADFDEIPDFFANFGNRKGAKCKSVSTGGCGPYIAKYLAKLYS